MNEEKNINAAETLTNLSLLIDRGEVTKDQVLALFKNANVNPTEQKQNINIQKILYYIGGFILFLGIVFYIGQYWGSLNDFSRTLISLGAAVSAYSLGYYFYKNLKNKDLGHAFLIVSAALFPLGIGTALQMVGVSSTTSAGISINAALLFIIYYGSYYSLQANIFLLFSFIAASTLFYAFTNFITGTNGQDLQHYYEYRTIVLGIAYISFGYYFTNTKKKFMTNILYFFGLLNIFGAAISLQGFSKSEGNLFWEGITPFLFVAAFYISTKIQNKIFLILATVFTFVQILKFTSEYFSDSVGWPISLMIAGLLMMGIGYLSFELNKRYIKVPKTL